MAITYTWIFEDEAADTKTIGSNSDVIINLKWRLKGSDTVDGKTITANVSGTTEIDTSDLSNFVAFSDLTKSQVETMLTNNMSAAELTHHKQVIADAISNSSDGFVNTFVFKPYVEEVRKQLNFD
tara:strand:+ start:1266 stop:1640 length:375 start_codon:yes stop_codon:yes gene_type:complete